MKNYSLFSSAIALLLSVSIQTWIVNGYLE